MKWMLENRRLWPAAALVLVVVAFLGPWGYEQIHVPREYSCDIRLKGDFCGTPVSGARILTNVAMTFRGLPGALLRGEAWWLSGGIREIVIAAFPFLLVLPLFTMIGRIARAWSRVWRGINFAAWGLGFAAAGFIAVVVGLQMDGWPFRAWGVWLYFGLAMALLIVEIVLLRRPYKPYLPRT